MRPIGLLVGIVVLMLVGYLVYRGLTPLPAGQPRRLPAGGRWQARHYEEAGDTVVAVARMLPTGEVLEEHVVARISDADQDWSRHFLAAKEEAAERAYHLNADS